MMNPSAISSINPSARPAAPAAAPAPAMGGAQQAPQNLPPALKAIVDQTGIIEWWLENIVAKSPSGEQIVRDYAQMAPDIVEAIKQHPDQGSVLQELMTNYLMPTTNAIKEGDYQGALKLYFCLMSYASKFAASMQENPEVESTLEAFADREQQMADNPSAAPQLMGQASTFNPVSQGNGGGNAALQPDPTSEQQSAPEQPAPAAAAPAAPAPAPATAPAAPQPAAPQPAMMPASPIGNIKPRRR